jgi:iron(III) transport system ATP-binding protein
MGASVVDQRTSATRSADVRYGLEARGITKTFADGSGQNVTAVDHIDLLVPAGQFWVLLGPSGCGKTTLLRCLAGLERPDSGSISMSGRQVFDASRSFAAEHQVGMVFQNYALWPHMTVAQNVRFPLTNVPRPARLSKEGMRDRVGELLELMSLDGLGDRKINQLSGGQQQRVALARAIAVGNDVVLFDEPLSNIDAKVREQLRAELRSMQRKLGFTALYVTHDQAEAFELADQIAVMRAGRIVQLAAPRELYEKPRTRYVAQFVGSSNLLDGEDVSVDAAGRTTVSTAIGPVVVSAPPAPGPAGRTVVASRSHRWRIDALARGNAVNRWSGTVTDVVYLGWYTDYTVDVDGTRVHIWTDDADLEIAPGATVWVGVDAENCVLLSDDD